MLQLPWLHRRLLRSPCGGVRCRKPCARLDESVYCAGYCVIALVVAFIIVFFVVLVAQQSLIRAAVDGAE
jgi:hypothetical protein